MKFANRGARKFFQAIQELPEEERAIRRVARRLNQDFSAVWRWLNTTQKPEYSGRKSVHTCFGVDMDDWELPDDEAEPVEAPHEGAA